MVCLDGCGYGGWCLCGLGVGCIGGGLGWVDVDDGLGGDGVVCVVILVEVGVFVWCVLGKMVVLEGGCVGWYYGVVWVLCGCCVVLGVL